MRNVEDIRQSTGWSEYLSFLGWNSIKTSGGSLAEYRNTLFGKIVKIQRPSNLKRTDIKSLEEDLNKLLLIKVEPAIYVDLKPCGFEECANPLLPPSTMYIDLKQDEKELRKKLSRSARYATNRAEREGVTIRIDSSPSDKLLKEFHTILKKTGKKNKFYVQPLDDLAKKRDVFSKSSFLVTANDKKGNILGGIFYLGHKKTIWSLHVATGKNSSSAKGNYLLIWRAILHFKRLGYEIMDMEGVKDKRFPNFTKKWGGFSEFKRRFGGEIVEFPSPQIKIYNPIIKTLVRLPGIKL